MAKPSTAKIGVEITDETMIYLNVFMRRLEDVAKGLSPFAYLGETPEQQHRRQSTGQPAAAPVREDLERVRRQRDAARRDVERMLRQRDLEAKNAMRLIQQVQDRDAQLANLRHLYDADAAIAAAVLTDRDDLAATNRSLRERLQKTAGELERAEAHNSQLRNLHGGNTNVLEANAQLRAENAELVARVETLAHTKKGQLRAEIQRLTERVEELLSEGRQLEQERDEARRQLNVGPF